MSDLEGYPPSMAWIAPIQDQLLTFPRGDEIVPIALPIRRHLELLHAGRGGWSAVMVEDHVQDKVHRILWADANESEQLDTMAMNAAYFNVVKGFSVHLCMALRRECLDDYHRGQRADVQSITCLWAELDGGDPRQFDALGLRPSLVVQTSQRAGGGGYHAYWLLRDPIEPDAATERILRQMATVIKGDVSVSDMTRNMRLPGSINCKPNRDGWRVVEVGPRVERAVYDYADFTHLDPGPPPPIPQSRHLFDSDERNDSYVSAAEIVNSAPYSKRTPLGYNIPCPCPGHGDGKGDRSPSLAVWEQEDGTVMLKCFAGCAFEDIVKALGLHPGQLFPRSKIDAKKTPDAAWNKARANRTRKPRINPTGA